MYGTHFPQRLKMEQYMVSQVQRLPGFKSEFVGLEILLGKNNDIDFEDYLGGMHISSSSCFNQSPQTYPIPSPINSKTPVNTTTSFFHSRFRFFFRPNIHRPVSRSVALVLLLLLPHNGH
eukprot:TRINITY_DN1257_c0_g1_i1.p1 TRINITY_DN1257_c0_g1~~TRINITY_DN1257_c0_g1_i1.p1  ORF type:complete len:120 (-),score=15.03 TRINITY_DN1257_c0_g1_i1:50-409(-)